MLFRHILGFTRFERRWTSMARAAICIMAKETSEAALTTSLMYVCARLYVRMQSIHARTRTTYDQVMFSRNHKTGDAIWDGTEQEDVLVKVLVHYMCACSVMPDPHKKDLCVCTEPFGHTQMCVYAHTAWTLYVQLKCLSIHMHTVCFVCAICV